MANRFLENTDTPTWCPGCGNFSIRKALAEALEEVGANPEEILLISGIGQAAKMPHYINANGFNGLHGRALPVAVGSRSVNPGLTCIVESGDGDTYGEGGNHFLHNIRRNLNIAHFVHNNQVYGLTKGQASPTSDLGMKTGVQTAGVTSVPFNPLSVALSVGAGFVARGFTGDGDHLVTLLVDAIRYPGYALVDILQPCVTFNRINTNSWYRDRVTKIPRDHDTTDRDAALRLSHMWGDEIPIGVFYRVERDTFEDSLADRRKDPSGLEQFNPEQMEYLQDAFRV